MSYAPLHLRSNFSLLRGASSINSIVAKAAGLGIPAIALTDENNLYGAPGFFKAAAAAGIRPILGATIKSDRERAVLLVKSDVGYANLCEIISRINLEESFSIAEVLPELHEGLFVLTEAIELAAKLSRRLDRGQLYLELVRPGRPMFHQRRVLDIARELCLPLAASCDIFFADPGDYELCEVLHAISKNELLDNTGAEIHTGKGAYLRSAQAMCEMFSDCPEALENTLLIADACNFDLLERKAVFPRVAEIGGRTAAAQLREKSFSRAIARYGEVTSEVHRRLDYEIEMICRLGFAGYFLIVSDIVDHARKIGTPTAGRGSGASSMIAYCLGITNADPLRFKLPFERFLNPGRKDYPDLDIDFCWRLRDDVIDYVYKKFGDDHVAMIATYATLQPRLAFREVAKVFGISNPLITRIAKKLRRGLAERDWQTLPVDPDILAKILELSQRLSGFPHHLSVHCGGVVITPGPIRRYAPLQRAQKGVVITQYDKDGVEDVGLVKLDLLGNRSLSTIRETIDLIKETTGEKPVPEALVDTDPDTISMLQAGNTVGCNQIESPAMRHLLQMMRPSTTLELMQALALIRPGAASLGMKEEFVRRVRGLAEVPPTDPRVAAILEESRGVMLYEDDALFIASYLAGLSIEGADQFRRAVTRCRSDRERLILSADFLGRCERNGVDMALAKDLWVQMAKFNSYSFCRAHAASYALLAWTVAYLKARYPAQFWTAALNNNASMYDKWVYLEEAKRSGIGILLPCVNRSREEFTLEDGAIRTGFLRVTELSQRSIRSIIEERDRKAFEGIDDFMARAPVQLKEAENLVRCGAFDFTGLARPALLWHLYTSKGRAKRTGGEFLSLPVQAPSQQAPELGEYTELKKFSDEWEILGLSARGHPIKYLGRLPENGLIPSSAISGHIGRIIRVAGVLAATRITGTVKGGLMEFLTLDDGHGIFEVTVFPDSYRRLKGRINGLGPYVVTGRVEDQYGALTITASDIRNS